MSRIVANIAKNRLFESNQSLSQLLAKFSTKGLLFKQKVDKSKVPVLKESELKEVFIHGSGPGGQNVNKLSNCVQLTHLPTGIVVKCHQNRLQQQNRVIARELLQSKLDDLMNGSESVSAQRHRLITSRYMRRNAKREKVRNLKLEFKSKAESKRLELNSNQSIESENDSNV